MFGSANTSDSSLVRTPSRAGSDARADGISSSCKTPVKSEDAMLEKPRGILIAVSFLLALVVGTTRVAADTPVWQGSVLPEPQILALNDWGGTLLIDRRVLAATAPATGVGDLPNTTKPWRNLGLLTRDYLMTIEPALITDPGFRLMAVMSLPADKAEPALQEALGRPLTANEKATLSSNASNGVFFPPQMNPFQAERLNQIFDTVLPSLPRHDLPPMPLPLRVYCAANWQLSRYDLATETVEFHANTCDDPSNIAGLFANVQAGSGSREGKIVADWTPLEGRIFIPRASAEALMNAGDMDFEVLVSFETDLTLKVEREGQTFAATALLSPRSNIRVHPKVQFTRPRLAIAPAALSEPASGTKGADETTAPVVAAIDPLAPGSATAMMALAGAPKEFPIDARRLVATDARTLGRITARSGPVFPGRMDGLARMTFGRGTPYEVSSVAEFLARALSVPEDHLALIRDADQGDPISGVMGVLPGPMALFTRPAAKGGYGQNSFVYEADFDIVGIHAFALNFANPLVVLTLKPVEGRYVTGGVHNDTKGRVLERFALPAEPEPSAYQVVDVPWRLPLVIEALKAGNFDVTESLIKLVRWPDQPRMDEFAVRDYVRGLIDRAATLPPHPESFWAAGSLVLGPYDFERKAFTLQRMSIGPIEVLRKDDLPPETVTLKLSEMPLLGVAEAQARNFAAAWPESSQLPFRALIRAGERRVGQRSIELSATMDRIELLRPGANLVVRDPAAVLLSIAVAPPKAPAPPAPPPPAANASTATMSLLGLHLGQSLDEAEAAVRAALGDVTVYQATPELRGTTGHPYQTGRLLHSEAKGISVALYSEPPTRPDVTAVAYAQVFRDGQRPKAADLAAQLQERFGTPLFDGIWTSAPSGKLSFEEDVAYKSCLRGLAAGQVGALSNMHFKINIAEENPTLAGEELLRDFPRWFDADGNRWTGRDALIPDPEAVLGRAGDCALLGEVLSSFTPAGANDGQVRMLVLMLGNPPAVEAARVKNLDSGSAPAASVLPKL